MPTLLVIQHGEDCPADRLGGWLAAEGVQLEVCRPYAGDQLPRQVEQDGLLVLGGAMGAGDDLDAAWLPGTRDLLADTTKPTLGVCLGAQLLAVARGGRVEVGPRGIEAGVVDVTWRPEAVGDRLLGGLPPYPGPSMHLDAVVTLPPGAVWLGETERYPHQAFRVGDAAWGVQFHPEVSPAAFQAWGAVHARSGDWAAWGIDGDEVVAQLERRDAEVVSAGRQLASRFGRLLALARHTRR